MTVISPPVLPGNILTLADSDFESGTPTWAALTNASALAVSSSYAFTGLKSLAWTASAAGDSLISTGYYPCVQNKGYDFSGYINTVSGAHDAFIGVAWYNSSHTQIGSTAFGNDNPSVANTWQSIVYAATSPAGAAFFKVVVWVSTQVALGETFAIDLMYASDPPAQVLIDFTNPSFQAGSAAGQNFADVTPWVRWDQNVTLSHGRQDVVSEIQPGQGTFVLQNDLGWFTPQKSGSPYYPNVSLWSRTQINVADTSGNWYTRFDGGISEIVYAVDDTGNTNMATVSVSDVLAFLNRQDPLSCWTRETVKADGPWLHWTLNDSGQTGTAAETSGNNGPGLRLTANQSGAQVAGATWANSTGGVETLANASAPDQPDGSQFWNAGAVTPSSHARGLVSGAVGPVSTPLETIYFAPSLTLQSAQNSFTGTDGYQLNGELFLNGVPQPLNLQAGNSYSVECWFMPDPAIKTNLSKNLGPFTVLSLGSGRQSSCLVAGIYYNGAGALFEAANYSQPPAFANQAFGTAPSPAASVSAAYTADSASRPHHLVITITGGAPPTATVYLDSVSVGTLNLMTGQAFDTVCVGGAFGGHGNFYGNIACVSIYQYTLSKAQINNHCQVGQYGHWESTTDNCIYWIGKFSGIPGYWNNLANQFLGLSLTEYVNIDSEGVLEVMQAYEQAERGLLYVNTQGQLSFHTRDWRMGYGAADLVLPSGVYNADLGYELVDTFLLNEAATSTITYSAGVAWTSQASQDSYGTYANGTKQSPVQLPLITWSRAYSQLGLQNTTGTKNNGEGVTTSAYGYFGDPNLNDNSAWQVNTRNTPALICGQLTVDLLTLDPTSGVTIGQIYGLDIDNVVTLTAGWGSVLLSGGHAAGVIEANECAVVLSAQATPMSIGDTFQFTSGPNAGSQVYTITDLQPPFAGFVNVLYQPNSPSVPSTSDTITRMNLPASFPDAAGAMDYFIEGINEVFGQQQWKITFYTSPASTQRAWKPGDATYGQLGTTSRIGISAPDVSTPAALGKDVSHDAGGPYWPPTFTTTPTATQFTWANVNPGTSIILTPNAPTGSRDCILLQVIAAGAATMSATDSAGNTYSQIGAVTLTGGTVQYVLASFGSFPLKTSDTITITGSVSQEYTTSAYDIANVTGVDGSAHTATGTSTSPSVSFGTLAGTSDFELVVITNKNTETVSIPSGWTQIGHNFQGAYQNQVFWKQASGTTGDTFSATLPTSTAWGALGIALTVPASTMNNPANNGHAFIGANDIRGIASSLQTALTPPLLVVGCVNHTQAYTSGNNGVQGHAIWDTVFVDTAGGMGIVPAWPNWYCVLVPGIYEISGSFNWQSQVSGSAGIRAAWIIVAQAGAQQVAAGLGSPYSDSYVCPIGEQNTSNSNGKGATQCPTTRLYLGLGDMVSLGVMQNQGSTINSFTSFGGPMMSLRWVGFNTAHDQVPLALGPAAGVVSASASRAVYTQSWAATGSFSYYGTSGTGNSPQLRSTTQMWTAQNPKSTGSQFSFATFPNGSIASALTGATILKVNLTMQMQTSYYKTGAELMIGWTSDTGFGSSFTPGGGTHFDAYRTKFKRNQTRTIDITGAGIGDAFQSGGATALAFGNNKTKDFTYNGIWTGGTNPVLTITYAK